MLKTFPGEPIMSVSLAQYAKSVVTAQLPKPAPEFVRSRLFDVPVAEIRRQKPGRVRQVAPGTLNQYPLKHKGGEINRPDKSEPKVNMTFNWDR